jgi:hypothetical protein
VPPCKANVPTRFIREQRAGYEICPEQQSGIERQRWQQCGAEPVIDHLHQCWKACCLKSFGKTAVGEVTNGQGMVTQAMAIPQQQQILAH